MDLRQKLSREYSDAGCKVRRHSSYVRTNIAQVGNAAQGSHAGGLLRAAFDIGGSERLTRTLYAQEAQSLFFLQS